ncbi:dynein axonemal heavy chain 1 [Episyrphus balteatus]|uniref:dynein axonemal heavy chain 1 n=1 Tax=Episyrphus balteatus TaxID=286459 RepID=UPI0024853489|nr:dynein axonemal heavy chain 1 [Episyrphus balteatus]
MSDSAKSSLFSLSILNSHESCLNPKVIPLTKPHYAYESLVEGCHRKSDKTNSNLETDYKLESAQKWITFPGKHQVEFPVQTIQPKVQMLRQVPIRQLPRDVEIDRRRRQHSNVKIYELLQKAGISNSKLVNNEEEPRRVTFVGDISVSLHVFDDDSFDTDTISGWLDKGLIDGVRHPLPAWGLIKTKIGDFSWQIVAVYNYNKEALKFTVIDLQEAKTHKLYRIHLMFMAENPYSFLERIKSALTRRSDFEAHVRYQMILDCTMYDEVPKMNQSLLNRIFKLSLMEESSHEDYIFKNVTNEILFQYQRVMVSYELQNFLQNHSGELKFIKPTQPNLNLPRKCLHRTTEDVRNRFERSKKYFRVSTLFYTGESIQAMLSASLECVHIESLSLFTCFFTKSVALSDFVSAQESCSSTVIKYLKYSWPENLSTKICLCLRSIGKGWLDLSVSDWNVFKVAKISRFFLQTKFRMQQSLQILMEKSIINYSNLLNNSCLDFLDLKNDYVWNNDLRTTPFNRLNLPPVFKIVLQLCSNGPFYSTDPKEFEPTVTKILYTTLMSTCGIRIIEPDSLLNLSFAKNLCIFTVELIEEMYIKHVEYLHTSYSKAVIPLNAYLEKFKCFVEFHEMVVDEYVQNFAQLEKSSQEVKHEIIWQKEQKENLKVILPEHIVIGPFQIIVEPLKKYLIHKRTEIIRKLFLYYVDRMFNINEELLQELIEINGKLNEKLLSVEQLFEVKAFMELVPDKMTIMRERIQIMILEYNILDSFFYNLSDQQFAMKWEAIAWPHKIMKRLIAMKEEHKIDIEEFKRIQIRELALFQERLESLNEEIMSFSLQFDPEKALEVAVEAKKTWKLIIDLQKVGNLLQDRQVLFETDELSLDYLESIIESFIPYRTMWTACSDFIKLEEITIGNPLTSIDLHEIKENISELTRDFEKSVEIFKEKEEVQNVAIVFLQKIQDFQPTVETIECIKNENWLIMHWQELAQRSGMDIKFSVAMNFSYCIKKGILNHVLLVKDIAEKAVLEADNIRLAMEEEERLKQEAELALLEKKKNRKCRTDI